MLHLQAFARQTSVFGAVKLQKHMLQQFLSIRILSMVWDTTVILFAKRLKFFLHTQPHCYSNSHLVVGFLLCFCLFVLVCCFFSTYQKHPEIRTRCTTTASNLLIWASSLVLVTCNFKDSLMASRTTPLLARELSFTRRFCCACL